MKKAIFFDLGNTLIQYFERSEFPEILKKSIDEAYNYISSAGKPELKYDIIWQRVKDEDHESKDYSVRKLEDRLSYIFALYNPSDDLLMSLCRCFMKPIFDKSQIYDDTLPVLSEIKLRGYKIEIVSNTAWGSPSELWNNELIRYGLDKYVDKAIFCRDVGWRKPDRRIFEFALENINSSVDECIFIGDDPRWDIAGPKAIGMDTLLIDRKGVFQDIEQKINNLYEIIDILNM